MKTIAIQSRPVSARSDEPLGKREVEDRQRRDDEQQHRGQRVSRPQLEQQVLARERRDVSGIRAHAIASLAVARAASASGS